jgi:hypothetical protein
MWLRLLPQEVTQIEIMAKAQFPRLKWNVSTETERYV